MVKFSIQLPESLANQVKEEAQKRNLSCAEIIIEALEEKFRPMSTKQRTMGDAFRECGGFFEGPGDLSTNPKYMEGYGE